MLSTAKGHPPSPRLLPPTEDTSAGHQIYGIPVSPDSATCIAEGLLALGARPTW